MTDHRRMNIVENMTVISRNMFAKAKTPMTVEEAVDVLCSNGQFRTLADIIYSYASGGDPEKKIVEGLIRNDPRRETEPKAVREAKAKRVRNWFTGKVSSISKLDAFEVCQILGLTLQQTDEFLMLVTGEAIHWRDPSEIIWAYAIDRGLSYEKTCELLERAKSASGSEKVRERRDIYTDTVKQEIMTSNLTEEELLLYLENHREKLGKFHNTAYQVFDACMKQLESGEAEDLMEDASKMTVRDILENYMYRRLVPLNKHTGQDKGQKADAQKKVFAAVQKSIRTNWPDEATLSKMASRKLDIPRKVLILLFLATDNGDREYEEPVDEDDFDFEEEVLTRDEVFQLLYTRLNQMLQRCGFRMLDPRNPFDWMVLFCICVDDIWDTDRRMAQLLQAVFPEENEKQNG